MFNKQKKTLDDLVLFCEKSKLSHFNSKETGYSLCVNIPVNFEEINEEDDTLLFAYVRLFHIGRNANNSSVTKEAAEKALATIKYKPVLANFCTIDDVEDFTAHDMEIDEEGNIQYIERQVGCFTSDEPYIQYIEEFDKEFIFAKIAIPREYTSAAEIIERKNGTKISVELLVNEMQYNAKEKVLELTDIVVKGATLLGRNPSTGKEVQEGMKGAKVSLQDFSENKNSICTTTTQNELFSNELIKTLEKLNNKLDSIVSGASVFDKKGGNNDMTILEELLQKYNVTLDDIPFDYEELSDEDLKNKFFETFEKENSNVVNNGITSKDINQSYSCSLQINGKSYNFELSAQDKISALYELVNDTYSSVDNTWYSVIVYDEYVIMQDWYQNIAYKQNYKEDDYIFTLTGERVKVYANYLTKEEEEVIETLRENYSSIESELNTYKEAELKTQRETIINDEAYAEFINEEVFVEIKEKLSTYSLDELRQACDLALATCYKNNRKQFSLEEPTNKANKIGISYSQEEKVEEEPYGDYFAFLKK